MNRTVKSEMVGNATEGMVGNASEGVLSQAGSGRTVANSANTQDKIMSVQSLTREPIGNRGSLIAPAGQEYVDPFLFETGYFESREEYEEVSRKAKIKSRARA